MPALPVYDFHTHSLLSDGELTVIELIRRAAVQGYEAIAITDHTGIASLERIISEVRRECQLAKEYWGIAAIPGVELTHLPPQAIPMAAHRAKELGAVLVVVHGETPVEPVPPGTNLAALNCSQVHILAHPGLLPRAQAALAAKNGQYLELSARRGHCLCNGHIAKLALSAGARLLVSSDAHSPEDLLTPERAALTALGAGLSPAQWEQVVENSRSLLKSLFL